MNAKNFLSVLCTLGLLFGLVNNMFGQVTIGVGEPPMGGAILQIKTIEGVKGAGENSNKGVLLPRVGLKDMKMLYPMFEVGYDKSLQDPLHVGLVVFNTNANLLDSNGIGMYFWNGQSWKPLTGDDGNGSIEIAPKSIFLTGLEPSKTAILTTGKSGQAWISSSTGVEASSTMQSIQNGKESNLIFKRSTTSFGDKIYTYKLADKPNIQAQILVSNLELKINKEIIRVGEGNVNGVVSSSTVVEPIGGDAKWELVDYSVDAFNWTVPPRNEGGKLVFELGQTKVGNQTPTGSVFGQIRVRHINVPGIVKTIRVEQNKEYRVLPKFDYMVIKYISASPVTGVDIDSATEILKSNVAAVDKKPVGYAGGAIPKETVGGVDYMFYGGDEKSNGSETSYVNIIKLNEILSKYPESSNQIEIGMSAWWYSNSTSVKNAVVSISVYKGGEMVPSGTTFVNKVDGVLKQPLLEFSSVPKTLSVRGSDSVTKDTYKTRYTPMYKLEYDRVDNTGVLIPWINWE
ncbi:hypothetical protein HX017_14120 [Myroides marinus]|uniref:hypothetical protein n=1 Tax=Myroides marinus TaxID=703342 RepID=UPI002575920E|nr:hypothetical protein [Myroides marinus]MDM1349831.1 hypothetical protein [Myroides marinus]MDM1357040.1 hypothetical protein [Myroides marinus]MDM1363259.1 hypothetical protein [Myroides marinus]MDM1366085.1 hypothetical protein [Myroides marinus]MDM1377326.1 hypothetical protein [Myroides marinus]